jgi:hypothetical protein
MNDSERQAVAGLALRALDTIEEDYGENAELIAASLVFEVKVTDEDGEVTWHGNYKSLDGNSPFHIAGLFSQTAKEIMS